MRFVLKVPERGLRKVLDTGSEIMSEFLIKKVASFVGQIISMSTVLGSVSHDQVFEY